MVLNVWMICVIIILPFPYFTVYDQISLITFMHSQFEIVLFLSIPGLPLSGKPGKVREFKTVRDFYSKLKKFLFWKEIKKLINKKSNFCN